jgi:hypothetical protein
MFGLLQKLICILTLSSFDKSSSAFLNVLNATHKRFAYCRRIPSFCLSFASGRKVIVHKHSGAKAHQILLL